MKDTKLGADSSLASMVNWDEVETPAVEVEQPKPESSLKPEETEQPPVETTTSTEQTPKGGEQQPKVEEPEEQKPTETPQIDEASLRQSIEQEVRETLAKEFESKAPKFANETIKKLNELALANVDIDSSDFWAWQSRDLDKYDVSNTNQALELRRLELEIENPDFSKDEIEWKLRKDYKALFDNSFDSEDEEYKDAMMSLRFDAKKSLTKLRAHKEKVTLPKVDLAAQEKVKEEARKFTEQYNLEVRKTASNLKELPTKLTDDLEIKLQVSDDARKFAEYSAVNNQNFFPENYTKVKEDGDIEILYDKLIKDMAYLADREAHLKAAYEQGVSVGKESAVDVLENAGESTPATQKQAVTRSYEEQIAEQVQRQFTRRR